MVMVPEKSKYFESAEEKDSFRLDVLGGQGADLIGKLAQPLGIWRKRYTVGGSLNQADKWLDTWADILLLAVRELNKDDDD